MVVHVCVHSRNLYMSVVKSLLYVEAFKTPYVLAEVLTNQAEWLFIHKGFLSTSVHDKVASQKMYQPQKGNTMYVHFPTCIENQGRFPFRKKTPEILV